MRNTQNTYWLANSSNGDDKIYLGTYNTEEEGILAAQERAGAEADWKGEYCLNSHRYQLEIDNDRDPAYLY